MLRAGRQRERVVDECRALGHHPDGPLGDSAELHHPLGEQIHVLLDVLVDLVEELVQRDERGTLHIPVGLFALRLQIDTVSESLIQQADRLSPGGLRQVVLRGIQPSRLEASLGGVTRGRGGRPARRAGSGGHP